MGEINLLPGRVLETAADGARIETATGPVALPLASFIREWPKVGDNVTICIRPEHITMATSASPIRLGEAVVTGSAFFGTHFRCHMAPSNASGLSLVAHMPQSANTAIGDRVELAVDPAALTVLPAA
nr:TOBE domain-containing protein [Pararhizobium arenae]